MNTFDTFVNVVTIVTVIDVKALTAIWQRMIGFAKLSVFHSSRAFGQVPRVSGTFGIRNRLKIAGF